MSAAVKTRVLTPEGYARWARKLFEVYRTYHRRLKMTVRIVGVDLFPYVDRYWRPWSEAFIRRERVNRRTTGRRPYEPPTVTPAGNLHDLVAHVCSTRHDPN